MYALHGRRAEGWGRRYVRGMGDDVISLDEAAEMLQITPDRVRAMVEEGLLDPVSGGEPPRFDPAQVRAVHDLGG